MGRIVPGHKSPGITRPPTICGACGSQRAHLVAIVNDRSAGKQERQHGKHVNVTGVHLTGKPGSVLVTSLENSWMCFFYIQVHTKYRT